MTKSTLSLRVSCLLALSLLVPRLAQGDDGSLVWHTIESAHFVVHYYDPHEQVARRVATVAERAHRTLAPALGHAPSEKTQVIVTDDTDSANGFASVVPRNRIQVFATAPNAFSTLNDHDDWLYGLVAHEYAHILHLDTIGGFPRLYNKVFGKTWAPNQIQPRWFIEGLATYEESKRSSAGRTRSAIFDMYLRAAVLSGKTLDLDAVSSGPLRWPHGNAAYLYGSHFLKYVLDRHGDDKLAAISAEYGRQPIPFGMNRAIERSLGRKFTDLYRAWVEHLGKRYGLERDAVMARGLIEGRRLTTSGESNGSPAYSADGKEIWWARSDGWSRAQYRSMPIGKDASASRTLALIDSAGHFKPLPDGSGLLLERGMNYRTNYDYGDLFLYLFAGEKLVRLTWGLRAADPDISPDGKWVAFTINGESRLRLAIMPLGGEQPPEIVWEGEARYDQAYSPSFSPDGRRLAFTAWTKGGYHDLYLLDLETRATTRLTHDRAIDLFPRFSPDGKRLFFSSDRTGIYNVYALELETGTLAQVTNVLGGTFTFDISPDGKRLVYRGFGEEGYEIFELELDESRWLVPDPYVNDRPDPVDIPDGEVAISAPRDYRPLETLAPNAFELSTSVDSFGSAISISTSGSDVIGRHAYSIAGTYGLTRGDVGFAAAYAYRRFWPSLRLSVGRGLGQPRGLVIDGRSQRYIEESWSATTTVGLPVLRRPALSSDLSFSYELDYDQNVEGELSLDPNNAVPRAPETGVAAGVAMRWSLSNARRYTYTLGPVEGRTLSASVRFNHPAVGSDFTGVQVEYRWQEYFRLPWLDHVVSLRLTGGIEQTDRRRDGRYSLGGTAGNQDLVDAILNSTRVGTGSLHGYAPGSFAGRQFHLLNLEYRVPIVEIEKGVSTVPIYLRRLHVAAFTDAGMCADDFQLGEIKPSVGASIRLDMVFGYYAPGTFDLGFARGLAEEGRTEWWFLLTQTI